MHHGTMLLNVDLNSMKKYLTPSLEKLKSKGVNSVEARVLNLQEVCPQITHTAICDSIIEQFCEHHKLKVEVQDLDEETLLREPTISSIYKQLEVLLISLISG
eukprot:TRINITY_DN5625_c0_g1_i1.p1 TRINITY_DN5625_c0_g1~~TRINITY_DN5625_c0_g1_i1.p1  ORF type:complete len:103 (+),score=21.24 TRINITY_DN5625_c0_g1_i1:544-852(+)